MVLKSKKTKNVLLMKYIVAAMLLIFTTIFVDSCGVYSFTGASTAAKTISIGFFTNKAQNAPIKASTQFTEALKQKFTTEGNLKLVDNNGELKINGYISNYTVQPKAAIAGATSGLVEIAMTVTVEYTNTLDPKDKWTQDFKKFAHYESSQSLSAVEDAKLKEINTQLVEDIFNKALVKW